MSGERFRESVFEDRGEPARAVAEGVDALARSPDAEVVRRLDEAASAGA